MAHARLLKCMLLYDTLAVADGLLQNLRPVLQRGYNSDWLGGVFSKAVFLGNGLMAILSGLLAHTLVETLSLGPVAPFDAASVVMLLGGAIVLFTWPENYGDSTNKRSFLEQLGSGAKAITQGETKWMQ